MSFRPCLHSRPWTVFLLILKFARGKVEKLTRKESIPVGCVLPASVATTRCRYQGGGYPHTHPQTYPHPMDIPISPRRDLGPGIPIPGRDLVPEIPPERTWDQGYPPPGRDLVPKITSPHPPPNRMTDTCKNITFPQLC